MLPVLLCFLDAKHLTLACNFLIICFWPSHSPDVKAVWEILKPHVRRCCLLIWSKLQISFCVSILAFSGCATTSRQDVYQLWEQRWYCFHLCLLVCVFTSLFKHRDIHTCHSALSVLHDAVTVRPRNRLETFWQPLVVSWQVASGGCWSHKEGLKEGAAPKSSLWLLWSVADCFSCL